MLITDAQESQDDQLRRREIRYVIMMMTRAGCVIAAVLLVSFRPPLLVLWLALCLVGMVVLPWLAVILANDRPPKARYRLANRGHQGAGTAPPALAPPRNPNTIDLEPEPDHERPLTRPELHRRQ